MRALRHRAATRPGGGVVTAPVADPRVQRMRAIRGAVRRLGIGEEDRRALQAELTGTASMRDMSLAQLDRLLDHFNRDQPARAPHGHAAAVGRKVRALWWTLYWLGAVDQPGDRAIDAFVKRQAGVEALRFLDHRRAHAVIDALKAWAAREGVVWPARPSPIAERRAVEAAIRAKLPAGVDAVADPAGGDARVWDEVIRQLGKLLRLARGRR